MCHQKMQKFLYISIVHGAHYVPNIKVDPYYLSKVFIGWNAEKKIILGVLPGADLKGGC